VDDSNHKLYFRIQVLCLYAWLTEFWSHNEAQLIKSLFVFLIKTLNVCQLKMS